MDDSYAHQPFVSRQLSKCQPSRTYADRHVKRIEHPFTPCPFRPQCDRYSALSRRLSRSSRISRSRAIDFDDACQARNPITAANRLIVLFAFIKRLRQCQFRHTKGNRLPRLANDHNSAGNYHLDGVRLRDRRKCWERFRLSFKFVGLRFDPIMRKPAACKGCSRKYPRGAMTAAAVVTMGGPQAQRRFQRQRMRMIAASQCAARIGRAPARRAARA